MRRGVTVAVAMPFTMLVFIVRCHRTGSEVKILPLGAAIRATLLS
jgi:hypothetical protein